MSTGTHRRADQDRLDNLHATLSKEFEVQSARLTELTADTGDPGQAHTQSALIAAARQSIEQIAGALRRIAEGSYGACERCQGDIPAERLEILPHARFCVPCQQKQNG
ncbi:TraR/DksA family transcriptional regulator [Micromonospora musae]|uniref:TraR/DksA family transcriptional regulator n=1 Tax=Micromonospora musae TaxID=1894970 RepID=A0A3A9YLW3_9ACTN|nr:MULTISPECIES: TraR/DksA family transcriptional regulator [Micromonospora]RKN14948.1 TraR/DksA family transcriptional regulator [Micromonospora musae]RKN35477.1 TraR/DksA family transcriptional regulator [Micromonospora musae]TYB97880.1 TraR/DksA family transcriptional regulator [Micromonospora sp. WP24]